MNKTKKRLLYTAYIITVTVFFLYYLFPSEDAKNYVLFYANNAVPDMKISLEKIEPAFPPGLLLSDVTVFYHEKPVVKAEYLKLVPGILSLVKRDLTVYFKSSLYDGVIQGRLAMPLKKSDRIHVDADIDDIQLSTILSLKEMIPHDLSGILKGAVTYEREGSMNQASAESDLKVTECGIDFTPPLYGVDGISFNEIAAGLDLKGSRLRIEQITGRGDDMDIDITGSVLIRRDMDKSIINMSGDISPHPALMGRLGKMAHVNNFIKSRSGDKGIGFRIRGTTANPKFSLK